MEKDVTQEAFLAAWRELPSLCNEERFSTWLYRIAYNGSMQQLERRKRDQARHSAMQQETKKP
jgi:RNA polymerase sigma-70 factor, ECF subfamily